MPTSNESDASAQATAAGRRSMAAPLLVVSVLLLGIGVWLLVGIVDDGASDGVKPLPTTSPAPSGPVVVPTFTVSGPDSTIPAWSPPAVPPEGPRPNLVVIQTDDQTLESLQVMERTRGLIAREGVELTQAVTSYPLCCPARAALLTGQLPHNNGVRYNKAPTGGYGAFSNQEATLPVALQDAGYRTRHVGKYLNGYGATDPAEVPPGWDRWQTLVDPSSYRYHGFEINVDGRVRRQPAGDYQTDVLIDLAVAGIEEEATIDGPFFLALDTLAPHVDTTTGDEAASVRGRRLKTAVPAPRHAQAFADEALPDDPAIDVVTEGQPPFVTGRDPIGAPGMAELTRSYRAELASLLAVDEGVGRMVDALERSGELEQTVIVFMSDNGMLHGQHRAVQTKYFGWDPAARIPLLIRGPGFARGDRNATPVSTVDVTATLLELAGAEAPRVPDGRSLVPLLVDPTVVWPRAVLIESGPNPDGMPVYQAVRTAEWKYIEYERGGVRELYDLVADPFEMRNLANDARYADVRAAMAERLAVLRSCAGAACR